MLLRQPPIAERIPNSQSRRVDGHVFILICVIDQQVNGENSRHMISHIVSSDLTTKSTLAQSYRAQLAVKVLSANTRPALANDWLLNNQAL